VQKWLSLLALWAVVAAPAAAWNTVSFGWEDGASTVLGLAGDGDPPILASLDAGIVRSGAASLKLVDNATTGTPQAWLAFVYPLADGDVVEAAVWRSDTTPDGAPSCRLWGHWNDSLGNAGHDPGQYDGSAGGSDDFGAGTGWESTSWSWTVADGHTGLVVEIRTYAEPGDTVWLDDLTITAPDGVVVQLPGMDPVASAGSTWSRVKSLFR